MIKFRNLFIAMAVLSAIIIFTSCQEEQIPVNSEGTSFQTNLHKFELPAGATFLSATYNYLILEASNQDINVHRITSPWEELVVTWNNFGGSYSPTIEATFNASDVGWSSVDVTSLVGNWLDGTYPNYGLLLDQVNKVWPRTAIDTREYNFGAEASYLEICYSLNGTAICDTTRNIGDTYVYELNPDENNGWKADMYTGWGWETDLEKQALVQFELEYTPTPEVNCETAYAYGEGNSLSTLCFLDIPNKQGNNWGWTNSIAPGTYNWPIYAGAGQCDISKGTLVGNLNVVYSGGTVTITYQIDTGYDLGETHVWVGSGTDLLPKKKNGKWDSAPGTFNHNGVNPVVVSGLSGNIWIAAHSGVCWEVQ